MPSDFDTEYLNKIEFVKAAFNIFENIYICGGFCAVAVTEYRLPQSDMCNKV